jgi:hypothetical protein
MGSSFGGGGAAWFIYVLPLNSRHDWQSRPKPMEEKRKHPRTEINEPAYVSAGGSVMSCVVRNISAEGAAIDVENPAFVPPRFNLVMANGTSVRECRVAWIQQKRIGVTFVAVPQELHDES